MRELLRRIRARWRGQPIAPLVPVSAPAAAVSRETPDDPPGLAVIRALRWTDEGWLFTDLSGPPVAGVDDVLAAYHARRDRLPTDPAEDEPAVIAHLRTVPDASLYTCLDGQCVGRARDLLALYDALPLVEAVAATALPVTSAPPAPTP